MRPTVGRIIHYFGPLNIGRAQDPLAAIVTEIPDHITVHGMNGEQLTAIGVTIFPRPSTAGGSVFTYWLPGEPNVQMQDGSFWRWPPRE